jgi:hypothetical protein
MCTATFLPYKNGFLLTHNRDEFVERPIALPPQTYSLSAFKLRLTFCLFFRISAYGFT